MKKTIYKNEKKYFYAEEGVMEKGAAAIAKNDEDAAYMVGKFKFRHPEFVIAEVGNYILVCRDHAAYEDAAPRYRLKKTSSIEKLASDVLKKGVVRNATLSDEKIDELQKAYPEFIIDYSEGWEVNIYANQEALELDNENEM